MEKVTRQQPAWQVKHKWFRSWARRILIADLDLMSGVSLGSI